MTALISKTKIFPLLILKREVRCGLPDSRSDLRLGVRLCLTHAHCADKRDKEYSSNPSSCPEQDVNGFQSSPFDAEMMRSINACRRSL